MSNESTPIAVPRENVNDQTVMLVSWLVADGDRVEPGQSLVQVETSKAVVEIEAPVAGFLRHAAQVGDEIAVGGLIGHIEGKRIAPALEIPPLTGASNGTPRPAAPTPGASASPREVDRPAEAGAAVPRSPASPARFSRRARESLERHGLDPNAFDGRGLVRSKDLAATLGRAETGPESAPAGPPESATVREPIAAMGVPFRTEPLPRSKRTEVSYLRSAYENNLMSSVTVSCRTRGLRDSVREATGSADGVTAIILFEVARLARKYPIFNAFHADGSVHFYEEVNVGFAIDAGHGLKVPVIHLADRKGIAEITDELRELVVAYLEDKLPVQALTGGTFTVTDLSAEGVSAFHPLINRGQSAILGISAEVFPPGGREGTFNLVLSFDHQLAEGRTAARFLNDLRQRLGSYEFAIKRDDGDDAGDPRCARCDRTAAELHKLDPNRHFLLPSVRPDGSVQLICTICMLSH